MGYRLSPIFVSPFNEYRLSPIFVMPVLLAESEGMLQRIADEFDRVCKRRKLKVNAGKSKVMVMMNVVVTKTPSSSPLRIAGHDNGKPYHRYSITDNGKRYRR